MFRQILYTQWKSGRVGLLALALGAFVLPLVSVQGLGAGAAELETMRIAWILQAHGTWGPVFPAAAVLVGTVLAMNAWSWDHEGDHVYALSLPVARWKWALLKMGAGLVLLLVPVAAFGVGAGAAAAAVELPEGLRAYPAALGLRFLLAGLVSYGLIFALASGTVRTVVALLAAVSVGLIVLMLLSDPLAHLVPGLDQWTLPARVYSALVSWPGPFEVYLGNWMLVDV